MKQNHQKSWAMAYCGIVAALCVALMLLGAVIPIAMFIAPAVAGVQKYQASLLPRCAWSAGCSWP